VVEALINQVPREPLYLQGGSHPLLQLGSTVVLLRKAVVRCRIRILCRGIGVSSSAKVHPCGWGYVASAMPTTPCHHSRSTSRIREKSHFLRGVSPVTCHWHGEASARQGIKRTGQPRGVCSLSLLKAVLESFTQEKRCNGSVTVVLLALQSPKGSLIS
jgi:hypothetical protein